VTTYTFDTFLRDYLGIERTSAHLPTVTRNAEAAIDGIAGIVFPANLISSTLPQKGRAGTTPMDPAAAAAVTEYHRMLPTHATMLPTLFPPFGETDGTSG